MSCHPRARPPLYRLASLLCLGVVVAACRDVATNPWDDLPADAVAWQIGAERDSAFIRTVGALPTTTDLVVREARVIRDSTTWHAHWDSITAQQPPSLRRPLPPVDFSSEMVILAIWGRGNYGYNIGIGGVYVSRGQLWVLVMDGFGETLCSVPQQPGTEARLPSPVALRLVPRRDGEPTYLVRSGLLNCNVRG